MLTPPPLDCILRVILFRICILPVPHAGPRSTNRKTWHMSEHNDSPVNIGELSERLAGDNDLLDQVIELFEGSYPQLLSDMDDAIASRNAENLRRSAHTLKGMVSNLGGEMLAQAAFEIEEMGREEVFDDIELKTDRVKELLDQFRTALREVRFPS